MNKYLEEIKALNSAEVKQGASGVCAMRIASCFEKLKELLFYSVIHTKLNDERINDLLHEAESDYNYAIRDYASAHFTFGDLISYMPTLKAKLMLDAEAIYEGDPACDDRAEVILAYPGFFAIAAYRLAHKLNEEGLRFVARALSEYAHSKTGIDINPGAQIGDSFFIDHGTGIVIGETCVIGNHVKLYQGVTLGALSLRKGRQLKSTKRHPTVEDNVTIYSGASIFGGETVIGHDSTIGSNAIITSSIPPHSIVRVKPFDLEINKGAD